MRHKLSLHCRRFLTLAVAVFMIGCGGEDNQKLTYELQNSLRTYMSALEALDEEALKATVYFPDVSDYRDHVSQLHYQYLEQGRNGEMLEFDPQGAVLCRFLGLLDNRYIVDKVELAEDGAAANMRISVNFAYDANIEMNVKQGSFEPGAKVFVPGQPFGKVHVLVIGEENPIPREQLKRISIDIQFRRTNREGVWQVREMEPDETSAEYVTSLKDEY